jgi:hypothetical protein
MMNPKIAPVRGGMMTWTVVLAAWVIFFDSVDVVRSAQPEFKPRVLVRRPFPPVTNPPLVPASEVGRRLGDAELVLGFRIDGKARAYPMNMLTGPRREIINDSIAGRPIAATW